MESDWYVVTPEYDNNDFIDDVIKEGESAGFMQAEVDNAAPDIKARDCKVSWIRKEEICQQVIKLFGPILETVKYDIDALESLQYTVYEKGHYYGWHIDSRENMEGKIRKYSMTMWLNDPKEYEGGDLEIEMGGPFEQSNIQTFRKEKGHIVFFHPHCWHRVTPVTKGVRKSLVGWFCGSPWK